MLKGIIRKIRKKIKKKKKQAPRDKWALFLSEKAGITYEEARARLAYVKREFGISPKKYCINKYYELPESFMATRALKDQRRAAIKQERYGIMERLSGKCKQQISAEFRAIRSASGVGFVNFRWYFDNGLYMLDPAQDSGKIKKLILLGERKKKLQNELKEKLIGIGCGESSFADIEEDLSEYRELVKKTLSEARKSQLADIISQGPEFAGKEVQDDILIDMEVTDRILDFSPLEYLAFHFWDKSVEERWTYVSSRLREKVIRMLNTEEGIALLDSKYDAYLRLAPLYGREIIVLDSGDDMGKFLDFCSRHSEFVKKNNYESVGRGVQKFDLSSGISPEEIYESITGYGKGIILEELIRTCDKLSELNPDSVNTVRIIVFADGELKVQDAFMKVGRKGSIVDNGGAGGIFVHVNLETGVFDSFGIDEKCFRYEMHPDHGYRFRGIALPEWDTAIEKAKAASAGVPEARYIGWDLTYTESGEWIIVEGNSRTQFFGQQMTIDKGIKKEFLASVGLDEETVMERGIEAETAREIEEMTGIPSDEIIEKIHLAESRGLDPAAFRRYRVWELTDEEQMILREELQKRTDLKEKREEEVASFIAAKTGLDPESVKEKYRLALECGYKEYWFIIDGIYLLSCDEIREGKNLRETEFSDDWHDERSQRYRNLRKSVRKQMMWNLAQSRLDFLKARNSCGCALDEYLIYGIWNISEEEASKLLTAGTKRRAWLHNATTFERSRMFQDKVRFSEVFADYMNRRCFTNTGLSYEDFLKNIEGIDRIVYKLREGEKGIGMETFNVNVSEEKNRAVYERLCSLGPGIVEEYLKQDDSIAEFYPGSVNTIRVITAYKDGKANVIMAAIRTGTSGATDNWSQGGISASIDPASGVIESDGADYCGERYIEHPVGNKKFRGFRIPHWDAVVQCCCKAAETCPDIPFVGWDVAVLQDGRVALIEGNPDFGIKSIQAPCAIDGIGLKERIEKYL